jgi:hypothetical protein
VSEVLVEFQESIESEQGMKYIARACGDEMLDGRWEGWIEFIPIGPGEPVRSMRETTQPNRADTVYWATGLTPVFLEGSLHRALNPVVRPVLREPMPPIFDGPAPAARVGPPAVESILNPFSVYRKGESLLRRQLSALSGWHLVNIISAYELSDEDPAILAAMEPAALVDVIIDAVRESESLPHNTTQVRR